MSDVDYGILVKVSGMYNCAHPLPAVGLGDKGGPMN